MTGRNPRTLANLIKNHGDDIWLGPDGNADRGDRYSHRPYKPPTEGPPPVTNSTPTTGQAVRLLATALRVTVLGRAAIDPIDANAPAGTQGRRIAAHNALLDLAKPGRDRFCGYTADSALTGPCILVDGHRNATFDDSTTHMDAKQRDRAIRYLVHSDPDPKQRA
jgi:hypothetical protein